MEPLGSATYRDANRAGPVVQAGGDLVLAGILERQADELKEAYAPWCRLEVAATDEGWILMTARRAE